MEMKVGNMSSAPECSLVTLPSHEFPNPSHIK